MTAPPTFTERHSEMHSYSTAYFEGQKLGVTCYHVEESDTANCHIPAYERVNLRAQSGEVSCEVSFTLSLDQLKNLAVEIDRYIIDREQVEYAEELGRQGMTLEEGEGLEALGTSLE